VRLHADRDPIDAGGAPRREVRLAAVGRVRFERGLERRAEAVADRGDQAREAIGPPQRRRAAAEVDRGERAGEAIRARRELAQDRFEVYLVRRLAELDREVAVRAQLAAPREVDVDTERIAREL